MLLLGSEQVQSGVFKLTPDSGPAFFLRTEYLTLVDKDRLQAVETGLGSEDSLFSDAKQLKEGDRGFFTEEESADILNAALIFSAESAAMTYLARAEHCRFSLKQKLLKKNIDKKALDRALDYLEDIGYLSDLRFAQAWLRNRYIDHAEGRIKLSAELTKRGISRENVKSALDDFFSQQNEGDVCKRAIKKLSRIQKDPEKMKVSLIRLGFSSKVIKEALKE